MTDAEAHEAAIQASYERFINHEGSWQALVELIAQRSPEKIERMEIERGLR